MSQTHRDKIMETTQPPSMTIPEVRAMTVYAPSGSFRIDHVVHVRVQDAWQIPLTSGDKEEDFLPPCVYVHIKNGQQEYSGTDGEAVLIELAAKGYYVDQEKYIIDRFRIMLKRFDAMFDDDDILIDQGA